ncbi:MAG: hypothetical protein H6566_07780 [Lewinellaceae bacterium]|nr:hypothetical protein [Lewinellaceae bacterium]
MRQEKESKTERRPPETTGGGNRTSAKGDDKPKGTASPVQFPTLSLPKGGGAIQGIGEKFHTNPVTGTGSMSVPLYLSPGRNGFAPQLALNYDSGSGNEVFGLGWDGTTQHFPQNAERFTPIRRLAEIPGCRCDRQRCVFAEWRRRPGAGFGC